MNICCFYDLLSYICIHKYIHFHKMAIARLTQTEKKTIRNLQVLERYNELKKVKTCRNAIDDLSAEFDLGISTVNNILFNPNYSNSPLKTNSGDTNTMPKKS